MSLWFKTLEQFIGNVNEFAKTKWIDKLNVANNFALQIIL